MTSPRKIGGEECHLSTAHCFSPLIGYPAIDNSLRMQAKDQVLRVLAPTSHNANEEWAVLVVPFAHVAWGCGVKHILSRFEPFENKASVITGHGTGLFVAKRNRHLSARHRNVRYGIDDDATDAISGLRLPLCARLPQRRQQRQNQKKRCHCVPSSRSCTSAVTVTLAR